MASNQRYNTETFPAIGDYGFIADCHSAALVSKEGSIDWCCMVAEGVQGEVQLAVEVVESFLVYLRKSVEEGVSGLRQSRAASAISL